mmetsp:Transcript_16582/g.56542  ORF Transcript_16582/g.56542 Transcript_16582/m.56542 type:complete len:416 (+) Transcript_16582:163-1410(+)
MDYARGLAFLASAIDNKSLFDFFINKDQCLHVDEVTTLLCTSGSFTARPNTHFATLPKIAPLNFDFCISKSKTKAVIVGCGNIAHKYMKYLKKSTIVSVTGVCSFTNNHSRAKKLAESSTAEVHIYERFQDVLLDPQVDVLIVLTLPSTHYSIISLALQARKHVFCEKPLATNAEDAENLISEAKKYSVLLECAPHMEDMESVKLLDLHVNNLGPIHKVEVEIWHGPIEKWHPNASEVYKTGMHWDLFPYPLTLILSRFGLVRSLRAEMQTVHPLRCSSAGSKFTVTSPDFFDTHLVLENGCYVNLKCHTYHYKPKYTQSLVVYGKYGEIRLDGLLPEVESKFHLDTVDNEVHKNVVCATQSYGPAVELLAKKSQLRTSSEPTASTALAHHIVKILEALDTICNENPHVDITMLS